MREDRRHNEEIKKKEALQAEGDRCSHPCTGKSRFKKKSRETIIATVKIERRRKK